jgi:hypothetical protein
MGVFQHTIGKYVASLPILLFRRIHSRFGLPEGSTIQLWLSL